MAYGRSWYDDGRLLNKMNSFYDLIDCASYFKSMGYKVVISGKSAGGLLVMGSLMLAPSVFSGCIAEVPFVQVVDMMSDPSMPLTVQEYTEWGDPADEGVLEYMKKYSPYDNVNPDIEYPPVLLAGSLSDTQTQFFEPLMMAKKLRQANPHNSVLLKMYVDSFGHQGNTKRIEGVGELAETFAFALACFKK
jgi:oligopeptidase B